MTSNQDTEDDIIDRMTAGLEPASDEEAAARAPYQRLVAQVKALNDGAEPPGGQARVEARLLLERDRERRQRRLWIGGGVATAIMAAALAVVVTRPKARAEPASLAVERVARNTGVRGGSATVGDTLQYRGVSDQRYFELRVYRERRLIVRCRDDERCVVDGRHVRLDLEARDPGEYDVVLLMSASPLPSLPGNLDGDVLAAGKAGLGSKHEHTLVKR